MSYINWPICGSSVTVLPNPLKRTGLYGLGCGPSCDFRTGFCGNGGGFPVGPGLGYFSTGLDVSGWGAPEWLTVAAAGALLFSGTGGGRRRSRRF